MFDKTFLLPEQTRTEYVTREVNVHEHRAPTDESVKLLNEFQEKARENILLSTTIASNGFTADMHVWLEPMSDKTVAIAKFELNGRQMTARAEIEHWRDKDKRVLFDRLQKDVAGILASEILGGCFNKLTSQELYAIFRQ